MITDWKGTYWADCSLDKEYIDATAKFLERINYFRRTRSEVLAEIPEKVRRVINITKLKTKDNSINDEVGSENYFEACKKFALAKIKDKYFKEWMIEHVDKSIIFAF